jgi:hypothetical protein
MKKVYIFIILLFYYNYTNSQSKQITFGVGPTTSLFYWNGGPIKNWGSINVNNIAPQRKNIGTSFSVQFNNKLKKKLDYFVSLSFDSYGIKLKDRFTRDNFSFDVDTREDYTTLFLSIGIEKPFILKKFEIKLGLGLYTITYFDQQIDVAPFVDPNTLMTIYKMTVNNRWGNEAGAQFGFRLLYPLSKYVKIGLNPIYFQTISAWGAEKLSANVIFAVAL